VKEREEQENDAADEDPLVDGKATAIIQFRLD
jgi:hypothetical protein